MKRTGLPLLLERYWASTVLLTVFSLFYTALMTHLLHWRTPYGLNLVWDTDKWWDLIVFHDRFVLFRTPGFWTAGTFPLTYPAPLGVLLGLLFKLPRPLATYLVLCILIGLLWVWWLATSLRERGVSTVAAVGFALTICASALPVWFLLVTANMEGIVALTLGVGVIACMRGRWWLGCAFIGAAGAMKVFPLILLGLALSQRRYREFAFGLLAAALVSLGALSILGPNVPEAAHYIGIGMVFLRDVFVFSGGQDGYIFNHSLFMPIKMAIALIDRHLHPEIIGPDRALHLRQILLVPFRIYLAFSAVLGVALYFGRIRKLPLLNQAIALTACATLLPPISLDYTLLHLLVPFGLLSLYAMDHAADAHGKTRGLHRCMACYLLIFTLGSFFTVRISMASSVRVVALALLIFFAMRYPLAETEGALP